MRYPVNYIAIVRGKTTTHKGVDFGWYSVIHRGQPIYAVADGEVIYKKTQTTGGKVIHIKHKGCVSEYGHLDSWCVDLGQKVKMGQKIGTMGATGKVTAMHLHFGLCKGTKITYTNKDEWLNPTIYLCLFKNQHIKNEKTKKQIKYNSKKTTTDLWVHNSKDYNKSSRVYTLKKGEEISFYGKTGDFATIDNLNGLYCSTKYLK